MVVDAGDRQTGIRRSDLFTSWLRSFSVHGSWNHRSLLATGLAFALLPVLRRIYAGDPVRLRQAMERHLETFNAHPYLAATAVGALARLEAEETAPAVIRRFRAAASGPLGALGDRAIWSAWRPFCLLVATGAYCLGWDAFPAVLLFVLLYNAGHVWVRGWGFRQGWNAGRELGPRLRRSHLRTAARVLGPASAVLLGAVGVGLVATAAGGTAGAGVTAVGWRGPAVLAAAGIAASRWPGAGRRLAPLFLALGPLLWWSMG